MLSQPEFRLTWRAKSTALPASWRRIRTSQVMPDVVGISVEPADHRMLIARRRRSWHGPAPPRCGHASHRYASAFPSSSRAPHSLVCVQQNPRAPSPEVYRAAACRPRRRMALLSAAFDRISSRALAIESGSALQAMPAPPERTISGRVGSGRNDERSATGAMASSTVSGKPSKRGGQRKTICAGERGEFFGRLIERTCQHDALG